MLCSDILYYNHRIKTTRAGRLGYFPSGKKRSRVNKIVYNINTDLIVSIVYTVFLYTLLQSEGSKNLRPEHGIYLQKRFHENKLTEGLSVVFLVEIILNFRIDRLISLKLNMIMNMSLKCSPLCGRRFS